MSGSPLLLTRYRDVRDALHDARLVIHKPLAVGDAVTHVEQAGSGERSHRVRPLWQRLAQQLRAEKVTMLSAFVEARIDRIAVAAQARGGMEVVGELAFPLPVAVMADLLGLPESDHAQLRPLFEAITRGHDIGSSEPERHHARFAQAAVARWIGARLAQARATPMVDAIRAVAAEVPEAVVGAGTILNPEQFEEAVSAGARFIVSPGTTPSLIDAAASSPVPLLPGAITPGELMAAAERGYSLLKFFPAEQAGGAAFLKSLVSPFAGIRFCPTGGIGAGNAADYLSLPNVICVGGSWVAPDGLVAEGKWDEIEALAAAAAKLQR